MDDLLHWKLRRWSTPLADEKYRAEVWARLLRNVLVAQSGCWEWQRSKNRDGYGQMSVKKKMVRTHQVSLAISRGAMWPIDRQIDHLCRNRACCNPEHLELVTLQENIRRGLGPGVAQEILRTKTHCVKGHLYDEVNTYVRPARPGRRSNRQCRRCRTEGMSRAYWTRKDGTAS